MLYKTLRLPSTLKWKRELKSAYLLAQNAYAKIFGPKHQSKLECAMSSSPPRWIWNDKCFAQHWSRFNTFFFFIYKSWCVRRLQKAKRSTLKKKRTGKLRCKKKRKAYWTVMKYRSNSMAVHAGKSSHGWRLVSTGICICKRMLRMTSGWTCEQRGSSGKNGNRKDIYTGCFTKKGGNLVEFT